MKKALSLLGIITTLFSLQANAHDLWSVAKNGPVLEADIVYGHHFPTPEPIANDRLALFEPMIVIGEDYKEELTQKGAHDYHFEGAMLKEGTYLVLSRYKPTTWIKKADGNWEMGKTRKDTHDEVVYCGTVTKNGKMILSVGDKDGEFATQPLNRGLEITPLVSPNKIKEGELVKFKLTQDGKAVKQATILGSYGDYARNDMSVPFRAVTDLKGEFEFRPLKEGLWYLKAEQDRESGNKDCETITESATLTFDVK